MLFVGTAQEKAHVPRTERRLDPATGSAYPWLVSSTAMVNYYYFYVVDEDFGPLCVHLVGGLLDRLHLLPPSIAMVAPRAEPTTSGQERTDR